MRSVISTAAIVMVASMVQVDRISYSPFVASAQDRVATVLDAARKAIAADKVKTLTAEGPTRRMLGPRDMEGTVTVTLERPGRMHRLEDMAIGGMVGGPSMERIAVLNGTTSWEDSQNRGGMGGGLRIQIATGPGPGATSPGGAALTPEQVDEARTRRMRVQMQRLTAALFADAGAPWADAGVAESPEGKADILEAKEETGRTIRLFIDQGTRLPLMVQYQDPKPRIMMQGGPGGPGRGPGGPGGPPQMTPEQMKERLAEMQRTPPEMGTYAMHLSDFKKVDGVMLPHKIETSLDGEPNEEWTIEKYKVNPQVKADLWQKK
jgi:hypothetical protein